MRMPRATPLPNRPRRTSRSITPWTPSVVAKWSADGLASSASGPAATTPSKLSTSWSAQRAKDSRSLPPSYIATGVNLDDDQSCYDARVRFGLVLNNEANVITLNDAAGFGAQAYYTAACDLQPGVDSPWKTPCGFAAGSKIYNTAGHIWIR